MSFSVLDIMILLCFIPAILRSLKKGFIDQIRGIATLLLGSFLAYKFADYISSLIAPSIPSANAPLLKFFSFVLIFTGIFIGLWILGRFVNQIIKGMTLGWLNRLFGVLLSIITTCLILGILFFAFENLNSIIHIVKPEAFEQSILFGRINSFASYALPFLQDFFKAQNG